MPINILLPRLTTDTISLNLRTPAAKTRLLISAVALVEGHIRPISAAIPTALFLRRAAGVAVEALRAVLTACHTAIAGRFGRAASPLGRPIPNTHLGVVAAGLATAGLLLGFAAEADLRVQALLALEAAWAVAEVTWWCARRGAAGA